MALACARDGTVERVLRDDVGFARAGARLSELVEHGSMQKAETFIAALGERECVAGWELYVESGDEVRPLSFAGAASGDSLIVFATPEAARSAMSNQLYEELSRLNNELINRERELARQNAALERVSAEKSRLAAIAAHDLRNPLTVIAAYADLLNLDHALEGEHALYVVEISRSAKFMMELVEEILDASRVESGHLELDLHDVDLVAAAEHAATINQLRAERKEIVITFEQQTEHAVIRADPVKLRQILNNLIVNAIKFSPSRTIVTIRVLRAAGAAIVEVHDRGIGIPAEKTAVIFEPFRTLGPVGTAGEKSTGLGLTIVKQLADLHRARVEVESEVGRGSVFRVVFPAI